MAAAAAPVLLANVLESMRTCEESIERAPAVPPALRLKLERRIWMVEFITMTSPGTPATIAAKCLRPKREIQGIIEIGQVQHC